jgi:hypothetical protein
MRYGQTIAFTTLVMFQIFNARSDERSSFVDSSRIIGYGERFCCRSRYTWR